ncbi:MAG: hypothetical protein HY236_14900, partial [Acidobacteria bacterium]|nr:hypothetical protein [Acidobacteriota bacterium]
LATDAVGNYEAPGLKYGNYKVIVSMPGFSNYEITGVVLSTSEVARADARLRPATAAETVVVTSEAPQIDTETPTIAATLDNQAIVELPRDSRDIYTFLYLNPNIVQGSDDGAFKFLGAQTYGASFSLDGQRSNGGVFGEPTSSQPSLEAVGQLVVLSNDFTAEYAGIANIRVETKRGIQDYHGSLFYNNKNSSLAAWNYNDKIGQANFLPTAAQSSYPNPYFNLNEMGGSFGGRVPRLKNTFFFAAYERRWFASPVQIHSTSLPHPSLWTGDFSLVNDSKKPAVPAGVELTAAEIAQNTVGGQGQQFITIPQRLLNPVTTAMIQKYFPSASPNYPINPNNGRLVDYFNLLPGRTNRDLGTFRMDHDFTAKDKVYWVFNITSQTSATSPVVRPFIGLGLTQNERKNYTFSLSHSHLFSNNLINEARGGFNRQDSFRQSNQTLRQFLANIGFDQSDIDAYGTVVGALELDTPGHPAVQFGNSSAFQIFSNGGRNTYRPLDQSLATFGDTLTWIKGKHTIKAGADVVRNAAVDGFSANRNNPRGRINYTGTGINGFSRFLMGLPANTLNYNSQQRGPMDVYNWEQGYFVQDDFKIHPKLTLYYGLRYEIITPFVETNDLLVNFDPNFVDSTTGTHGRFVVPSSAVISQVDPRMVAFGITTADKLGLGPQPGEDG